MMVPPRIRSLRWRLPLLILALLGSTGGAFTWTAHREMRRALRQAGDERAQSAALQVADLLTQGAAGRLAEGQRLAADPAIRHYALTGEDPDAALAVLKPLAQRSPQARVWLSAPIGSPAKRLTIDNVTLGPPEDGSAGTRTAPAAGVGPLEFNAGGVTFTTTTRMAAGAEGPDSAAGFLSIQRPLSASSAVTLVEHLIGSGAAIKFANVASDVWTNLSVQTDAPPAIPAGDRTVSFADRSGVRHLGTSLPITNTPWRVWVEFNEASLMQPAATLLQRMWPWTVGLIVLGVTAVWIVSARVTRPLEQMADAADAIASGDYSRRATARGNDEVGRLGSAFNTMAARVAESRDLMEARVQARTQELSESREEMDQFFAMSLDLLCIADLAGTFTRVNPAWEQVLGWSASDLTAVPYLQLVHPDDAASTARESAQLADGGTTVDFENRYQCKDGQYRWLSWKAVANPRLARVYATARDVTDEKRAARELQQYASDLTAANRELEAFSYSVSHDLRSPLRSIDGFSQALLEDCGDQLGPDGQEHLRRIRGAAQHMGMLIDDLLKLSRVTRAELNFETIDLSELARRTLTRLTEGDATRNVEWHVQPGLQATGDARLLDIAMTNLIENAWKFTRKRTPARIEFGARNGAGRPREYYVRDNGAGFDVAYSSKLFAAFQRLHHASEFPGTGIGLATVQRIVTRHGGHIRAEGVPEQGATFAFTLQTEPSI